MKGRTILEIYSESKVVAPKEECVRHDFRVTECETILLIIVTGCAHWLIFVEYLLLLIGNGMLIGDII